MIFDFSGVTAVDLFPGVCLAEISDVLRNSGAAHQVMAWQQYLAEQSAGGQPCEPHLQEIFQDLGRAAPGLVQVAERLAGMIAGNWT